MTTIFDKILSGEIPCDEVFSDEKCLAFKDITPQAPTHILIIPRKPIPSLQDIKKEDQELLGHLLLKGTEIANAAGLESWRTIINTSISLTYSYHRRKEIKLATWIKIHFSWFFPNQSARLSYWLSC